VKRLKRGIAAATLYPADLALLNPGSLGENLLAPVPALAEFQELPREPKVLLVGIQGLEAFLPCP
jgi:hypothetical protein